MVPTLLNIGHGHFPGLISKVVVVNLSWTQRYMWNVVQRVLPRYALDKIAFATSKDELAKFVDLQVLPEGKLKTRGVTLKLTISARRRSLVRIRC